MRSVSSGLVAALSALLAVSGCGIDDFEPAAGTDGGANGGGDGSSGPGDAGPGGSDGSPGVGELVTPNGTGNCSGTCDWFDDEICCVPAGTQSNGTCVDIGAATKISASSCSAGSVLAMNCASSERDGCPAGSMCCQLTETSPFVISCTTSCPTGREVCHLDVNPSGGCRDAQQACIASGAFGNRLGLCTPP